MRNFLVYWLRISEKIPKGILPPLLFFFILSGTCPIGETADWSAKKRKSNTVYDHTKLKTPYPVRFAKLSSFRRCQYWGQGWLGNPTCRTPIFFAWIQFWVVYFVYRDWPHVAYFGFSATPVHPETGSKFLFRGLLHFQRGQISRVQVVWQKFE